jgi:hypothetical protein
LDGTEEIHSRLKINIQKEENFRRSKTRHLLSTNPPQIHHKSPAINHAFAPQISATPLKKHQQRQGFLSTHHALKKMQRSQRNLSERLAGGF